MNSTLNRLETEIRQETETFKESYQEKMKEFEAYFTNLEEEFIKRSREKANTKLQLDRIFLKVNHVIETINDSDTGMKNLSQVVACLVENALM